MLDAHIAAPHGVAADGAGAGDAGPARETEFAFEVALFFGELREVLHAFDNLYHAFLALALLAAGGGDLDAEAFGVVEERGAGESFDSLSVDGEKRHGLCTVGQIVNLR